MKLRRWALLGILLARGWARSEELQAPADDPARFRVGINLGVVTLPRPLLIEGYARVHPYLGVQVTVSHSDTLSLPPGTPPDVERDVRNLIHFGAEVPLPVLSFRIGYHFG